MFLVCSKACVVFNQGTKDNSKKAEKQHLLIAARNGKMIRDLETEVIFRFVTLVSIKYTLSLTIDHITLRRKVALYVMSRAENVISTSNRK